MLLWWNSFFLLYKRRLTRVRNIASLILVGYYIEIAYYFPNTMERIVVKKLRFWSIFNFASISIEKEENDRAGH